MGEIVKWLQIANVLVLNTTSFQGRRKGRGGGVGGVGRPPLFEGANFIHFLYKVLVERSMQK